jgi:hypothetical protein
LLKEPIFPMMLLSGIIPISMPILLLSTQ